MKNMLTLIVLLSSWLTVYSQESYTEAELKQKCDSIHPSVAEKEKISAWLKARVGAKKLRLITE